MSRALRIEYPGAFYHVLNRGQRREAIVRDERDRERFVSDLERTAKLFCTPIHSYCLMTNHFHLIVETPQANLSRAMHWLHASYACYYNRRHRCNGHVFQGRFKAILIEAGPYLEAVSRYIHRNPVRAAVVSRPWDYPWSSCRYFVGRGRSPAWLEVDRILGGFARGNTAARRRYAAYVSEPDLATPFDGVIGGLILGSEGFVRWVRDSFLRGRENVSDVAGLSDLHSRPAVDDIVAQVGRHYGVRPESILARGHKNRRERDVAIYLARELAGLSGRELGCRFGGLKGAGIAMRCTRLLGRTAKDRRLAMDIAHLRLKIAKSE
jgi:REP element-mobilizing transposase RayT